MRSKLTRYAATLLFALLGAALVFALGLGGTDAPPQEAAKAGIGGGAPVGERSDEGRRAPDFEVVTLDSDTLRLSDHVGEVVVLNFWATWCATCRVEIPELIEMQSELQEEDVRFVGISVDHEGDEVVRTFVEEAGINYPIAVDDGSISEKFDGVYALPTTIVIDREGTVRHRISGIVTRDSLMPLLRQLGSG